MKAKKLFPDVSFKRLWDKIKNLDELNNNLGGLRFGIDGDGNYGYYKADDSFVPFKQGLDLNFELVAGTTAPASCKTENTIWINTDVEINSWQFSAIEPTSREDNSELQTGDIWIKISEKSNHEFNALKKFKLMIYPVKVSQYIEGKWVGKQSMIYQNEKWNTFYMVIYENGISNVKFRTNGSGPGHNTTWGATSVKLDISIDYYHGWATQWISTEDIMDLRGYDSMFVEYEQASGSAQVSQFIYAAISSTYNISTSFENASANIKNNLDGSGIITLDISSVNEGYPVVGITNDSTGSTISRSSTATFKAIYFR